MRRSTAKPPYDTSLLLGDYGSLAAVRRTGIERKISAIFFLTPIIRNAAFGQ
jgi:hypothetical protein